MATRAEVCDALTRLCYLAKREMPVVGDTTYRKHLSGWDIQHEWINAKLTDWERTCQPDA